MINLVTFKTRLYNDKSTTGPCITLNIKETKFAALTMDVLPDKKATLSLKRVLL